MERLLEETLHPENADQTRERAVFGRAKLLPGKSPCLLPPRAPCFAPQAKEKGERAGLFHVWAELVRSAFGMSLKRPVETARTKPGPPKMRLHFF